MVNYMLTIHGV